MEPAQKGEFRKVHILEYRRRFLDDDGLQASVKPILDGLKLVLYRKGKQGKEPYAGAGLIYDDDHKHCSLTVKQEKVEKGGFPRTEITVSA